MLAMSPGLILPCVRQVTINAVSSTSMAISVFGHQQASLTVLLNVLLCILCRRYACRSLVAMVQDNLLEPTTLTPVAVGCIWKVLDTYGALPVNYICRMLAHAGLVQRLYAVVKQLVNIDRQQRQRGIGSGGVPRAAVGDGLKLHHLHSPSSPSVFGQVIVPGLGADSPGASPDAAWAAAVDQPAAAAAATDTGRKGIPPKESLAGRSEPIFQQ